MTNRRLAIAALAAVTAVGLAGCARTSDNTTGTAAGGGAATTATQTDPTAELTAAAVKLTQQSMKVSMDMAGGITMSGVADPKADKAEMTMTLGTGADTATGSGTATAGGAATGTDSSTAGTAQVRKIGKDVWMKFAGSMGVLDGFGKGKWMHLDTTALGDGGAFGMSGSDPAAAAKLIKSTSGVKRTADHQFAGVIDLTRAQTVDSKLVGTLGEKAKSVPFTATTDDQGRLVGMTIDMSGLSPAAGKIVTKYSDFGTPVSVSAPPAADVQEIPGELKGILGGN